MSNELNIFSVSTGTPADAILHGAAAARAWVNGSLRADDQLDLSAELHADLSARLGGAIADGLLQLNADLSGSAHAGIRLQAGMPIDLFEAAGLIARLRLEASVSGQARVTAAMTLGEFQSLVLDAFPPVARPYVRVVLDEARVGATVWARGSFAAMAVAELMAVADLFPAEGSPGVSAWFNYGFAWGYGGNWGLVLNTGFDTQTMLRRLAAQAGTDLGRALTAYREQVNLAAEDPLNGVLELAQAALPLALDGLVAWCQQQLTATAPNQREALVDALDTLLQRLVTDLLLPRILRVVMGSIGINPQAVDVTAARRLWADLVGAVAALGDTAATGPLEAVGSVAELVVSMADLLPPGRAAAVRRGVRCAAALAVVVNDDSDAPPSLQRLLAAPGVADSLRQRATQVLTGELGSFLTELQLVPQWLAELAGDLARLVTLAAGDDTAGIPRGQTASVLRQLLQDLTDALGEAGVWDHLATAVPPDLVRAIRAEMQVLIEVCTGLAADETVDAHRAREAVSVGILVLLGRPLSQMTSVVAERGFAAVPPGLRALADEFDGSDQPVDLNASWGDLARQVAGTTVGFPVAQLLRHVAHTTEQWAETVLPEEIGMLDRYLLADTLVDQILTIGVQPAISAFKRDLLPALGRHVVDHVAASLEFLLADSVNLFETMVAGTVQHVLRELELAAVLSFQLAEQAVDAAERAVGELQQRADALEGQAAGYAAAFVRDVVGLADHIRGLDAQVGRALTNWLVEQCLGPANAAAVPDWLRPELPALVTAAVNAATGGILQGTSLAVTGLADILRASAEALRITAESQQGAAVGIRALIESLFRGDQIPSVTVPIGVDVPNPILPFILPPIHINITEVQIPANVLSGVVLTLVFDSIGVGPLLRALDDTATSLRATRAALATIREAIAHDSAQRMRTAINQSGPAAPLAVEILEPQPGTVVPATGTIAVRLVGVTWSFVDPRGEGLPAEAISRLRILVNGQDVPLALLQWADYGTYMEGRITYGVREADRAAVTVPIGPVAVAVLVVDGVGATTAERTWHFVVTAPPELPKPVLRWFPIAVARPFLELPSFEVLTPVSNLAIRPELVQPVTAETAPANRTENTSAVAGSLAELQAAADRGDGAAAFTLWERLHDTDFPTAEAWLWKAADLGDVRAAYHLGLFLWERRDVDAAEAMLRRATLDPQGAYALGRLLWRERSDPQAAIEWFDRAARADDPAAQRDLGIVLRERGDLSGARYWLGRAAGRDDEARRTLADLETVS